ncbi:DUF3626 domain-containing protein [Streptomyces kaempferi]
MRADIAVPLQEKALQHVAASCRGEPLARDLRVTMHFHPDRSAEGHLVLAQMVEDHVYRSQFVTGTSNAASSCCTARMPTTPPAPAQAKST